METITTIFLRTSQLLFIPVLIACLLGHISPEVLLVQYAGTLPFAARPFRRLAHHTPATPGQLLQETKVTLVWPVASWIY